MCVCERRCHTAHQSFFLEIVLVKPVIFVAQDCRPLRLGRVRNLEVPLPKIPSALSSFEHTQPKGPARREMRTFDISQAFIVGKAIILCVATSRRLLSTIMRPCTTKVVREGERESGREGVCVGKRDTDRPHEVWDQSCSVVPLSTVSLPACHRMCQHIVFICKIHLVAYRCAAEC
jgi:hypothetical protein